MAIRGLRMLLGDASPWDIASAAAAVTLLWLAAWGLRGTRHRLFTGDVPEKARLSREARSQPMPHGSHDITPRVQPMFCNKEHDRNMHFTWFGPTPRVMIPDPELVREILSNNRFGKLRADGVASHQGEKWAKHRRILNPAFHHDKIKRMLPVSSTCCEEMITRWENSMSTEGSSDIDVCPEFQNLTGDVISRTAFGSNYEEGMKIFQLQRELGERLIQAFQTLFIPGYWFLPTKNNRRIRAIDRDIRMILHGIIGKKERAIKNNEASSDDLLGLLLDIEDITEECKLFYFAGMETPSVLLTWTLWQEQAKEEVLHQFGRTRPDFENLSRLKVVTMILYEVLRLYPPAIFLTRRTYKAMELDGFRYLVLPLIFIHHDPDIWLADGMSNAAKHPAAFFPFGGGPRICIGQNFALLEAKMALTTILQRFSFELSPSYIHAPYTVITLQPQHGA
ncbi:hypothetical protein ZWY2020_001367 [Hordeum vulgare]|nr:hypothetical protein ZWY2020_001367 [Hordeum vulgare]